VDVSDKHETVQTRASKRQQKLDERGGAKSVGIEDDKDGVVCLDI
jgi:hypothetical protein